MEATRKQLKEEPVLLEIEPPEVDGATRLVIVGDIHGQLADLNIVFEKHGMPSPQNRYIFNGDFVDRGPFGLECLILVLAFKVLYPSDVFLIRGNHEEKKSCINTPGVNTWSDLTGRYSEHFGMPIVKSLANDIAHMFGMLSLCAIIRDRAFVVHGGLFRQPHHALELWAELESKEREEPYYEATVEEVARIEAEEKEVKEAGGKVDTDSERHKQLNIARRKVKIYERTREMAARGGVTLDDIKRIERVDSGGRIPRHILNPMSTKIKMTEDVSDKTLVVDMLYSDPKAKNEDGGAFRGVATNDERGKGVNYGSDVVEAWLSQIKLPCLIRSHECVQLGCERMPCGDYECWTVFSCSNYDSQVPNLGGVLYYEQNDVKPQTFTWNTGHETEQSRALVCLELAQQNIARGIALNDKDIERSAEADANKYRMKLATPVMRQANFKLSAAVCRNKSKIRMLLEERMDGKGTPEGTVDPEAWIYAMKNGIGVEGLPWAKIQPLLAPREAEGGRINVEKFLSQYQIHFGSPTVVRKRELTKMTSPVHTGLGDIGTSPSSHMQRSVTAPPGALNSYEETMESRAEMNEELRSSVRGHVEALYKDQDRLQAIFDYLDLDGNGAVDKNEFLQICGFINEGMEDSEPMKGNINFERLFEDLDVDSSGTLDVKQFKECFHWHFDPEIALPSDSPLHATRTTPGHLSPELPVSMTGTDPDMGAQRTDSGKYDFNA